MSKRARGSRFAKWGIITGAIAGGAALIPLVPVLKKRAMRVTTILKKDHRVVSGLILTLQLMPRVNGMLRRTLLEQIQKNFMAHAQAEEEVLYPAMRNYTFIEGYSKVDEAYREHQEMKDVLNALTTMDPTTDAFDMKLADFKSKIRRHVEEEEGDMFSRLLLHMSTDQQEELGRRIHERKMDLKTQRAA